MASLRTCPTRALTMRCTNCGQGGRWKGFGGRSKSRATKPPAAAKHQGTCPGKLHLVWGAEHEHVGVPAGAGGRAVHAEASSGDASHPGNCGTNAAAQPSHRAASSRSGQATTLSPSWTPGRSAQAGQHEEKCRRKLGACSSEAGSGAAATASACGSRQHASVGAGSAGTLCLQTRAVAGG